MLSSRLNIGRGEVHKTASSSNQRILNELGTQVTHILRTSVTPSVIEGGPMPWKGVTVTEQKQRLIEDFLLNCYSKTELVERFRISRRTAHKWIDRYEEQG